jgi:hypothetical protein
MSRYKSDDGSTWGGIMVVIAVIAAFAFGYHIRNSGYVLNINQQPTPKEVQAK